MASEHWSIRKTERREGQVRELGVIAGLGDDFSAVIDFALSTALAQYWFARTEQEATMDAVRVEFSEDGLFGGWTGMEFYDVEASKRAYAVTLEAALRFEFPGREVEVVSGDQDRAEVGGFRDHKDVPVVEHIVGETYQSFAWVRYTREGVADSLDTGFWLQRSDGVIVDVGEIEVNDDGAIEYLMTWHKGALPAHQQKTYTDKGTLLDAMELYADFECWNPVAME